MGLETATYISGLNASNPIDATDLVNQGDDHLRLVKSTLLNSFPGITGAMTKTHTELNAAAIKTDASSAFLGTAAVDLVDNGNPINIGTLAGGHLAFDPDSIQAKDSMTTAGLLQLNELGGNVRIGAQSGTGSVEAYHNGGVVLASTADGVAIRDSSGSVPQLLLQSDAPGNLADLQHSGGELLLRNFQASGEVSLRGDNAGGTEKVLFTGDPDGAASMGYAGDQVLHTTTDGIEIRNNGAGNVHLWFQDNTPTNLALVYADIGTDVLHIRNYVTGGWITLAGNGGADNVFRGDPDAAATLYYAGTARLATSNSGLLVSGSVLDLDNSGAAGVTSLFVRNSEGGYRLKVDGGTARLMQISAAGSEQDTWAVFNQDGRVQLYHNNGSELETQSHDGSYSTSGARVNDHGGTLRDVGFNTMHSSEVDASITLNEIHSSRIIHRDGTANLTYTLPSGTSGAIPPVGATTMVCNENATGTVTIAAAGTLRWFDGAGTPSTGNRTLAHGGVCTVYHYSNTEWWIWGNGLS